MRGPRPRDAPSPEVTRHGHGEGTPFPRPTATSEPICARSCLDEAPDRVPSPRPRRLCGVDAARSPSSRARSASARRDAGAGRAVAGSRTTPRFARSSRSSSRPSSRPTSPRCRPPRSSALDADHRGGAPARSGLRPAGVGRQPGAARDSSRRTRPSTASSSSRTSTSCAGRGTGRTTSSPSPSTAPHPPGAGFYPEDVTADAFKAYVVAHPDQKDALESLTTVVVRDGDKLKAVALLAGVRRVAASPPPPSCSRRRRATQNKSLAKFLTSRAAAFAQRRLPPERQGLDGPRLARRADHRPVRDVRRRPARPEGLLRGVRHRERPGRVGEAREVQALLPDMERNLPIPAGAHGKRGGDSPIRVVDLVFTSGEARTERADDRVQPAERRGGAQGEGREEGAPAQPHRDEVRPHHAPAGRADPRPVAGRPPLVRRRSSTRRSSTS